MKLSPNYHEEGILLTRQIGKKKYFRTLAILFLFFQLLAISCLAIEEKIQVLEKIFMCFPDDAPVHEMVENLDGGNCIPDTSQYEIANLLDVIDGDSIKVRIGSDEFEVRYIGVDTPEFHGNDRDKATSATLANKMLLGNDRVYLFKDVSETDRYGRLLRYVVTESHFINFELVMRGYAQSKSYPPDIACNRTFFRVSE